MESCPGWQTARQRAVRGLGGYGTYDALMRESMAHPRVRYIWGPSRMVDIHESSDRCGKRQKAGAYPRAEGPRGVCGTYNGRMCASGRSALVGEAPFTY